MPYFGLLETLVMGLPCYVTRTGWSGEAGFELYALDNSRSDALRDHILEVGGASGLMVTSSSEMRRIEAGILNLGLDLTPYLTPFGAGLGRFVDLGKESDFIGKGALQRAPMLPPARKLTGIVFDENPGIAFEDLWPVQHDGRTVGRCTAAAYSPQLGTHIGYVNVPASLAEAGTRLTAVIARHRGLGNGPPVSPRGS